MALPADRVVVSTPLVVAINALDLLTGGTGNIMGKHSAPEKAPKKSDDTVTRLYDGAVVVSKR